MPPLLALLLLGCAAACSGEAPAERGPVRLMPSAEAWPFVEAALSRWEAAGVTPGAVVLVSQGGAPVTLTDELIATGTLDEDGAEVLAEGATHIPHAAVEWVRVRRGADARVWVHELGHVLGFYGHTDTGVMRDPALGRIDEASLLAVCAHAACEAFRPEV